MVQSLLIIFYNFKNVTIKLVKKENENINALNGNENNGNKEQTLFN
jgi:hypothetical protein